jgi:hypothetical protein
MRKARLLEALCVLLAAIAVPAAAQYGPAPSWVLTAGAADTCSSQGGFSLMNSVYVNNPNPASELGVLSAPGNPNLGFTQDSSYSGVLVLGGFFVFVNVPYSLPANTPLTLEVTTYNQPNQQGGVSFVSTITWDCTTGELVTETSVLEIPTLSGSGLAAFALMIVAFAVLLLRRRTAFVR